MMSDSQDTFNTRFTQETLDQNTVNPPAVGKMPGVELGQGQNYDPSEDAWGNPTWQLPQMDKGVPGDQVMLPQNQGNFPDFADMPTYEGELTFPQYAGMTDVDVTSQELAEYLYDTTREFNPGMSEEDLLDAVYATMEEAIENAGYEAPTNFPDFADMPTYEGELTFPQYAGMTDVTSQELAEYLYDTTREFNPGMSDAVYATMEEAIENTGYEARMDFPDFADMPTYEGELTFPQYAGMTDVTSQELAEYLYDTTLEFNPGMSEEDVLDAVYATMEEAIENAGYV